MRSTRSATSGCAASQASRASEAGEELTLGDDGRVDLVVDWKSDVAPAAEAVTRYRGPVRAYLDATGALEGSIVLLSSRRTVRVGDTIGGSTYCFDGHQGRATTS